MIKHVIHLFLYYLALRFIRALNIGLDGLFDGLFPEGLDSLAATFIISSTLSAIFFATIRGILKLQKTPVFTRAQETMRQIGRTHSTIAWISHLGTASICIVVVLTTLASLYLPLVAGDTAPGLYTGKWKEHDGWRGKTWRCVFEFTTPRGTYEGTLAGAPDNGEKNKRETCLVNPPEQIAYYPANPDYHYPKGRSQPLLFNYPATIYALLVLCAGLFYLYRLLFIEGRNEEDNDCNYALLWAGMSLAFLVLM